MYVLPEVMALTNLMKACASSSKNKHKHVRRLRQSPHSKHIPIKKRPIAHPNSISRSVSPNQPVQDYYAYTAGHLGSSSSVKIPCEISSSGCGLRCSFWSRLSASICFSSSFALACSAGAALICGRMLPVISNQLLCPYINRVYRSIVLRWRRLRKRNTHVQQAHPDRDDARDVSSGCLLYAGAQVLLWLPEGIYVVPVRLSTRAWPCGIQIWGVVAGDHLRRHGSIEQDMSFFEILRVGSSLEVFLERIATFHGRG